MEFSCFHAINIKIYVLTYDALCSSFISIYWLVVFFRAFLNSPIFRLVSAFIPTAFAFSYHSLPNYKLSRLWLWVFFLFPALSAFLLSLPRLFWLRLWPSWIFPLSATLSFVVMNSIFPLFWVPWGLSFPSLHLSFTAFVLTLYWLRVSFQLSQST